MTRVLICDDSTEARRMLRTMLDDDQELEIVGEASDGGEAIALGVDLMPTSS
jgi:chemotaxis response regulator CheB